MRFLTFMKLPMNADYWFVAFSLLVVILVSSYGATHAGYQTGMPLFYQLEAMKTQQTAPQTTAMVPTLLPETPDKTHEIPITKSLKSAASSKYDLHRYK